MSAYLKRSISIALAGGLAYGSLAGAAPTAGSAYYTDPQYSHVEDATSKGIGQVNMIACIMSAMKPDALVNEGDYIALVDQSKCDPNSRSSSSNSGASGDGAQAADYMTAVVNSSRASNSDPMRVKIWIDDEQDGQPATIFVNVNATSAPSTANPYGEFRLDFCGVAEGMPGCVMQGFLQGFDGGMNYFQHEGDGGRDNTVALRLTNVGTSTGSGKLDMTQIENNISQQQTFAFAYDDSHFLRGDQCFSRDAADPETGLSVWRYGLYDANSGARVTRNSGFPIEYTANGTAYHGYLGYWGLSLPSAAQESLSNGATVQKVDYSNNSNPTRTDYTVVLGGGKLVKYTKKSRTLHDLDQISFTAFVGDVTGFIPNAVPYTSYEMHWDETQAKFVVTGRNNCSQNGCQTQALDAPYPAVAPSFWQSQGGVQGWSNSLGGEVFVDLHSIGSPIDSSTITVIYRAQDLVYPSDLPATLYCVRDCPTAASLSSYFAQGSSDQSPFASSSYNNWNASASYVTYGSNVGGELTSGGQPVVFTDREAYQEHPQYQNGVRSGRLFENLADASCGSGVYCDYKVNDVDVYYVWETGPNNWNQFAAVKDSNGAFVQFDAPLQLNYSVPNDAVRYHQYAGKSIVLQYGGYGDLWGIPGQCVSALTNQPISCDQDNARYVPDFVIPYDTTLGLVSDSNNSYLAKWLDREIRFARKDLSACGALSTPSNVTLPTEADLKNPTDSNSDAYIGAKPTVTSAPRVIHGDVKY